MINTTKNNAYTPINYQSLRNQLIKSLNQEYGTKLTNFVLQESEYTYFSIEYIVGNGDIFGDERLKFNRDDYGAYKKECISKNYTLPKAIDEVYTANEIAHQIIINFVNDLTLQELFIVSLTQLGEVSSKQYIFHATINDINFCFNDYSIHYQEPNGRKNLSTFIICNLSELASYLLTNFDNYKNKLKDNPGQIDSILYLIYRRKCEKYELTANIRVLQKKLIKLLSTMPNYQSGMVFKVINYTESTETYSLPFNYLIRFTNWFNTTSDDKHKINIKFVLSNQNELGKLVDEIINSDVPFNTHLKEIRTAIAESQGIEMKVEYRKDVKALIDSIGSDNSHAIKSIKDILYELFNISAT